MKNMFFFVVVSGALIVSCVNKNKVPSEIIQPKEMQSILWDVIKAESLSAEFARKDSSINEVAETKLLTAKVFEVHKIDSSEFNKSYNWYTSHPDILKSVIDSLNSQNHRESEFEMRKKNKPVKINPLKKIKAE